MLGTNWVVMPGFRPGIHEFVVPGKKVVDPRAKPEDDDRVWGSTRVKIRSRYGYSGCKHRQNSTSSSSTASGSDQAALVHSTIAGSARIRAA